MSQPENTQAANSTPSTPAAQPPGAPASGAAPQGQQGAQQPAGTVAPPLTWEAVLAAARAETRTQQPAAPATPAAPVDPKPATPKADDIGALREQFHRTVVRTSVGAIATDLGAINADDVISLMRDTFQVDDAGNVMVRGQPGVAVKDAVAAFLNAKPHLMKPAVPGGGSGAPAAPAAPAGAPAAPDPRTLEGAQRIVDQTFSLLMFGPQAATSTHAAPGAQPNR